MHLSPLRGSLREPFAVELWAAVTEEELAGMALLDLREIDVGIENVILALRGTSQHHPVGAADE
jgi:hypothetical protein